MSSNVEKVTLKTDADADVTKKLMHDDEPEAPITTIDSKKLEVRVILGDLNILNIRVS
jgi:hypothetical protein